MEDSSSANVLATPVSSQDTIDQDVVTLDNNLNDDLGQEQQEATPAKTSPGASNKDARPRDQRLKAYSPNSSRRS